MSKLKPFHVELTYSGVVMAADDRAAQILAERISDRIVRDSTQADVDATELRSLAHLARLDPGWDGECCAYGGDAPYLRNVLPEEDPPERDTATVDMFAATQEDA